jgi:hypothetical protein
MGRGLSELQRAILKIAHFNRTIRPRAPRWREADVRIRDVLIYYYGFPFHSQPPGSTETPQIFRRRQIGVKSYQAASVATSKSIARLVKRGLAEEIHGGGGGRLTTAGIAKAEEILKMEAASRPKNIT